jgi:hypothetical protein
VTVWWLACVAAAPELPDDGRGDSGEPEPSCTATGVEVCNGVDDDCDGRADDADPNWDRSTGTLWFADADGDGFGDPGVSGWACVLPAATTTDDSDCDDARPDVHPGAPEVCGGLDEDCDGLVDEADADLVLDGLWTGFADRDGDGHGDPDQPLGPHCAPPPGAVLLDTDCDDLDASVSPDATEVCGDGLDQNCDGVDASCHPALVGDRSVDAADATWTGDQEFGWLGYALLSGWDLSGDGVPDLVVGEAARNLSGVNEGRVLVFGDPASGGGVLPVAVLEGESEEDKAGGALAWGGDADGDGFGELLVGARTNDQGAVDAGCAYVIEVPLAGTLGLGGQAELRGFLQGDQVGDALAGPGDLDGDGLDDWIIGARLADVAGADRGAVWWVGGGSDVDRSLADGASMLAGSEDGEQAGVALATANVDGDGVGDLVVGSHRFEGEGTLLGRVSVIAGPVVASETADAPSQFVGDADSDRLGERLAAGDVDGDGHDDVLAAARFEGSAADEAGAVFLWVDAAEPLVRGALLAAAWVGRGVDASDRAGDAVAIGDLDGDGFADVAVGSEASGGGMGRIWVHYGPLGGDVSLGDADATTAGTVEGDGVGGVLALSGDVDNDGYADLVAGAPDASRPIAEAGAVWLFWGGPR